jgi:hypothetical protein
MIINPYINNYRCYHSWIDKYPEQVLLLGIWSMIMIIDRTGIYFFAIGVNGDANKRKGFNSSTLNNWNKCSKKHGTCQPDKTLMLVERVLMPVVS